MKKVDFALLISICSATVAVLALLLNLFIYREARQVEFKWEVYSRNDIPLKLIHDTYLNENGRKEDDFKLPVWIQCQITNTFQRTFSVASIFGSSVLKEYKLFKYLDYDLFAREVRFDAIPTKKISLPFILQAGHSKAFFTSIRIPIPKKLFDRLKDEFKNKEFTLGDVYRLEKKPQSIGCKVYLEINLAGGQTKIAKVDYLDL